MSDQKKYKKVDVVQKNSRTTSIIKRIKPCPVCGFDMFIVQKTESNNIYKGSKISWKCSEEKCNHRELEENALDKKIRFGFYDND